MKRFLSVIALIVLCFAHASLAQQTVDAQLFEVRGVVKSQDKISLAGLNLFFKDGESIEAVVSDENGAFAVKLPVGKYKVTANSAVSKNFVAFVEVSNSNLNPTDFELTLEINKCCCSRMSDGNVTEVVKHIAPTYPAAARAVRATGEVVVTIKIDNEGKVIASKVESGHPLLRAFSEQAAKLWLFSPDESGMEREGKIVFAFVQGQKKKTDVFTKPNRLEIFVEPYVILNTVNY